MLPRRCATATSKASRPVRGRFLPVRRTGPPWALAVPGFVDAHTHTSDLRAAVWPFPRARPPYATSGRIISRPGPALAGKAIPQDGPEDLGASQYAPAHRSRYLRPTAALSAIVCRNLPNAEAGAVSLHLHFNLPAEIRIAEGELLEPVPANGVEGVRVARAMEQAPRNAASWLPNRWCAGRAWRSRSPSSREPTTRSASSSLH
jgi:hypothetical protein